MPGPFTHIYAARRVADLLNATDGSLTDRFIRPADGKLLESQQLDSHLLLQSSGTACGKAMADWPKFAAVGAIGPDLFFFLQDYNNKSVPCDEIMLAMSLLYYLDDQGRLDDPYDGLLIILSEVSDTWASILRFVIKLEKIWAKFMDIWNKTIGRIVAAAGQLVDDLTGGLYSELGTAFSELGTDLMTLAQEELLSAADIFDWFSLKMRKGFDEKAFLWSDMTHYRRTSVVPAQLFKHAREMKANADPLTKEHGEQLLAFSVGWVCHVATDIIGHSFVNEQCGGPFRTHWQRHHVIENQIDGWNYESTKNGPLPKDDFIGWQPSYQSVAESALYFAVQIPQNIDNLEQDEKQGDLRQALPDGDDQDSKDRRKELLDTDGALPLWMAEKIVQTFIAVYASPDGEGGDATLQKHLDEGPAPPHPQNLRGQQFQDELHDSTRLIGKWLGLLGIDNVGMALDDLRKIIAPDPPPEMPRVPEGFPLPWEIMAAYRFMLSWFKRQYMSSSAMDRPEPPPILLTPPASDFIPQPPDFSGVNSDDPPLAQACEAILAILDWAFKQIEQVIKTIGDIIKMAASLGTWPLREAIYAGILLPLWEINENMRMVLVHLGYAMPQSEQRYPSGNLKRANEVDKTLVTLGHSVDSAFQEALAAAYDPLGNLDKDPTLTNVGVRQTLGVDVLNPYLPVRVPKGDRIPVIQGAVATTILQNPADRDLIEFTRPWAFPDHTNSSDQKKAGNWLEQPLTIPGPYASDTVPHQLLSLDGLVSNSARTQYQGARCPDETDDISKAFVLHAGDGTRDEANFEGTNPLGDPIVFSAYLIGQIANNPNFTSSFNLDADRGYGYLCWDWVRRDAVPGDGDLILDGQGHRFRPPTQWPEGSEAWARPDPAPAGKNLYTPMLELHYPGRVCPERGDGDGGDGEIR